MKRISVTTLEKFRRYMASVSQYDTEAALVESLQGLFEGNDYTRVGSAYHKILEGQYKVEVNHVLVAADGLNFAFSTAQAMPGIEYHRKHTGMLQEQSIEKIYDTVYGPIQVTARVDGLKGRMVRDGKTKYKPVVPTEYTDSFQWRFYLDMLGLSEFYFDVFEFIGFKGLTYANPIVLPEVHVVAHDPIPCQRYEGMAGDVHGLLSDFLSYIDNRGHWDLLKAALEPKAISF